MPIDRADFAEECVRQALYCGVNPHYMLGVAQLRSGISDTNQGSEIGPFRLVQEAWNASCVDTEFDFNFQPSDINDWDMQIPVFALMTHRATDAFVSTNARQPSAVELYMAQWPNAVAAAVPGDLTKALNDTSSLLDPAASAVLGNPAPPPLLIPDPTQQPPSPQAGPINLATVPADRRPIAQKILNAFAVFGQFQQAAALANAIAESNLNPNAHAAIGEDSWGLFQLNRKGGLGMGHSPTDLENPDTNIAIVLAEAQKFAEFTSAATLDGAVSAFVRNVERPRDIAGEIVRRLNIAQKLT